MRALSARTFQTCFPAALRCLKFVQSKLSHGSVSMLP
jgi:hypothetical protein